MQSVIPGLSAQVNRLSAIGISTADNGRLVLNTTRLQDVISGNVSGVTADDVRKLFALSGKSTSGNVSFLLGSAKTKASTTPYQVDVTQAAERASITGAGTLAASTIIDGSNNSLIVNVDGKEVTLTLASGTYTQTQLSSLLQSAIDTQPDLAGRTVSAGVTSGGTLNLRSDSFGGSSRISVISGTALSSLGVTAGLSDSGLDVAGNFIVAGQVESATGRGQILIGESSNANTADLQAKVTLSTGQITSGVEASITVSRGVASLLDAEISDLTNSNGLFTAIDQKYVSQIDSIKKSSDREQAVFDKQQASLTQRFTALEAVISQLQNTSNLLGTQLTSLGSLGGSS